MLSPSKIGEVTRELLNSAKVPLLPEDGWLPGYGAARRFIDFGSEAATRRAKVSKLLTERQWQWDRIVEVLMADPPLRVIQAGFDQVTELDREGARKLEQWHTENLIPFDPAAAIAKFGLETELEAAEEKCAKQAMQNQKSLQEMRQRMNKGMGMLAGCYQRGEPELAHRTLLEDVIPAQSTLSVVEPDRERRQKMWVAYVCSRDEMLPKAAAERYVQLKSEQKHEDALKWLDQTVEGEFFPWELRKQSDSALGSVELQTSPPDNPYRCEPSRFRLMIHDDEILKEFDGWVEKKIGDRFKRDLEDDLTNLVEDFDGREDDFHKAAVMAAGLQEIATDHNLRHDRLDMLTGEGRLTKYRNTLLALTSYRAVVREVDALTEKSLRTLSCAELKELQSRISELGNAVRNPPDELDETYRLSDGSKADFRSDGRKVNALENRVRTAAFRSCQLEPILYFLGLFAVVALIGTGIHTWTTSSAKASELRSLIEAGEVIPVEIMVEEAMISGSESPLKTLYQRFGPWKGVALEAQIWTDEQREMENLLKMELIQLEELQNSGFDQKSLQETDDKLRRAGEDLGLLASDLQEQLEPRASALTKAWDQFVGNVAANLAKQIQGVLDASKQDLETLRKVDGNFVPENYVQTLQTLEEGLTQTSYLLTPEFERLTPRGSLPTEYEKAMTLLSDLKNGAERMGPRLAAFEGVRSFSAHKTVLNQLSSIPENVWRHLPPDFQTDFEIVKAILDPAETFAAILLGDANTGLSAPDLPLPAEVDMNENTLRLALVNDWKLAEIYRYVQSDDRDKIVYAKGELEQVRQPGNGETVYQSSGTYYVTSRSPDQANFQDGTEVMKELHVANVPANASARTGMVPGNGKKSKESMALEDLGLREMVRAGTPLAYNSSYLGMIDRVLNWSDDVNVLFKAHIHQKLGEILMVRPGEWGLERTSFRNDLRQLSDVKDGSGRRLQLDADSWMVPEEVERWSQPLENYYETLEGLAYEQQYRNVSAMVASLSQGAFSYAGFVDVNGVLRLNAESPEMQEPQTFWILVQGSGGNKGAPQVLKASGEENLLQNLRLGKGTPLRFSPVLVNGDVVNRLIASSKDDPQLRKFFGAWLEKLEAE